MNRVCVWTMGLLLGVGLLAGAAKADEAEKPAGTATLVGKVVDADGKGVADVPVRVVKPMHREPRNQAQAPARPPRPDRPAPVGQATTDADGKFKIENLPAGEFVVFAAVRQQQLMAREMVTLKDGEQTTVTLTLKKWEGPGGGKGGKDPKPGKGGAADPGI